MKAGQVRFEYKHFVWDEEAHLAAQASECAADQGKFWEYHDILFDRQGGSGAFSRPALKGFASELKLDRSVFDACLDGGQKRRQVDADTQEAQVRGLDSTPSIFVNQRKFVGVQPFSVFQGAIEQELQIRGADER